MADRRKKNVTIDKTPTAPRPDYDEKLKAEVGGAIDRTVFDDTAAPDDYKTRTAAIDDGLLSRDRLKKSRRVTTTKILKTTDEFISSAERYYPTLEEGLTDEQVSKRVEAGLINASASKKGKSYLSIFLSNIFTFFNMLTFTVAITLIAFRVELAKFFFMLIVLANITVGIIQEIRSKRMVDKLKLVTAPTATVIRGGEKRTVPVGEVVLDDIMFVEMGKQICADAVVVKGEAELNEALLTGESVPVKKAQGDMLYSGSFVSGGNCYARVDKVGAANYVEKLTSYAKRYRKPKSELRESISLLIKLVSIIIIPVAALLLWLGARGANLDFEGWRTNVSEVGGAVIGMIPSGMFLLTSVALATSVIRLAKKRTLVQDLYCIEMLARVNVLCLDKTGTITDGTMRVHEVADLKGHDFSCSVSEIIGSMLTATGDNNQTALALADRFGYSKKLMPKAVMPFSSQKKLSAVTFEGEGTFVLGAPEFVMKDLGARLEKMVNDYARDGYRVMLLAHTPLEISGERLPTVRRAVCLIVIEDHIREDAPAVIRWFKENNVAVKIISGDNPITVSEVARRVGVKNADKYISLEGLSQSEVVEAATRYTVFGRVTPEQKCTLIKALKAKGNTVAMTGDGVNDILAMREADCSIAIASGSEAARNVSHLVLLDSNFSSMPEVVMEGRRVVNNVQQSSSLFLMKTLMSILLSIIAVPLKYSHLMFGKSYFFDTSNLTVLEIFVVAIPSFFLALQPNKNIIKGKFLANVLRRCIPGGITLTLSVMCVYFYRLIGEPYGITFTGTEYTTMMVAAVVYTALFALARMCTPMNAYRALLVTFTYGLTTVIMTAFLNMCGRMGARPFGDVVSVLSLGFTDIMFLLSLVLISYFVLKLLTFLMSKVKISEKGELNNDSRRVEA